MNNKQQATERQQDGVFATSQKAGIPTDTSAFAPLTPRQYLWQLLRYKPWLWLLTVLAYMILYGLNFAPPLIARAIFNRLAGESDTGNLAQLGLWSLVALLLGSTVGRQAAYVALSTGQTWYAHLVGAMVRANL
ncbi:MAG: hypothetical protein KDE58_02110, partial [Caldilineaceae bacterium]|nr:hypothetical protein [Caldilineaceae bacterium]